MMTSVGRKARMPTVVEAAALIGPASVRDTTTDLVPIFPRQKV